MSISSENTERLSRNVFNDCNGTRAHNHLVRKPTLNYLCKSIGSFLYGGNTGI